MTKNRNSESWIVPDWNVPRSIKSVSTTRLGGESRAPYDGFNLALHVGDDASTVACNRQWLKSQLSLPQEPFWLEQVHGIDVVVADDVSKTLKADASVCFQPGPVCVVMTADCMPILLADSKGRAVAAVHAGWKGLLNGVIEAAVKKMETQCAEIVAWIGPSILQSSFEVGDDVKDAFCAKDNRYEVFFAVNSRKRWQADLVGIAKMKLRSLSISQVSGGDRCTFSDAKHFYSYRRDQVTGRMASLVWIDES